MPKTKLITVALDALVPHPLQDVYDPTSTEEFAKLRKSIVENGLDMLISVFPAIAVKGKNVYVVLDGWRRAKTLRAMGKTSVKVRVRHDLPAADSKDGQLAFLRQNAERRQLDTLQRVRVAVKQFEITYGNGRTLSQQQLQRAREEIGKLLGLSGRNVARYLRVLRTPQAVQRAVSASRLRLIVAERVADADADVQALISKTVEKTTANNLNAIVAKLLNPDARDCARQHVNPANALAALVRALGRGMEDLDGRVVELSPRRVAKHLSQIAKARKFLRALHGRATGNTQ